MELIHTLNGVVIEEPIGFDSLKMSIKRGEYHGMSAEVSVGDLEFYGVAAKIIKQAYDTDIDTEITYKVVTNSGNEIYTGVIDLSTYNELDGAYRSVACKVGEVGVKTMFNNRADISVNINGVSTIDGEQLEHYAVDKNITIPKKHIAYTNKLESGYNNCKVVDETNTDGVTRLIPLQFTNFASVFPCKMTSEEYGAFGGLTRVISGYIKNNTYLEPSYTDNPDMALWQMDEGFIDKYGDPESHTIELDVSVELKFLNELFVVKDDNGSIAFIPNNSNDYKMKCSLVLIANDKIISQGQVVEYYSPIDAPVVGETKTLTIKDKLSVSTNDILFFGIRFEHSNFGYLVLDSTTAYPINSPSAFDAKIKQGSYIKMKMYDNITTEDAPTDMVMVYDALRVISSIITENELDLKSDWYDYYNLTSETLEKHGGACKAITNGYKIRDIKDAAGKEFPMSMSFKDIIESLNPIDCIGWGITEEDGKSLLRVERWDWFYKDNVMLQINGANEKRRKINNDVCITNMEIGYNKYVSTDVYNSVENLHSTRTFSSPVKAISKEKRLISQFIADNYAIELARRAKYNVKESESYEYDESIFIFELEKNANEYTIPTSAYNSTNIDRESEFINAKLTPGQCAARWASYLFNINGVKEFKFVTSTANSNASFSTRRGTLLSMASNPQAENADIKYTQGILTADLIELTYPISLEDYNRIKANPYGLVVVDGEECWIKEFQYDFNTSEADFKLIPKAK